jgi:hypothetical protein
MDTDTDLEAFETAIGYIYPCCKHCEDCEPNGLWYHIEPCEGGCNDSGETK